MSSLIQPRVLILAPFAEEQTILLHPFERQCPIEVVVLYYAHTHSGPDSELLGQCGKVRLGDSLERLYDGMLPHWAVSATRLALSDWFQLRPGAVRPPPSSG